MRVQTHLAPFHSSPRNLSARISRQVTEVEIGVTVSGGLRGCGSGVRVEDGTWITRLRVPFSDRLCSILSL